MSNIRNIATLILLLFIMLGAVGCERQGPAERAGENIDNAIDDAGEGVEDMGDEVEEATD